MYSDIKESKPNSTTDKTDILVKLYNKIILINRNPDTKTQNVLKGFINDQDQYDSIGVIGMEFANGYQTLFQLQNHKDSILYKYMILYLLLELALQTGYTHADFHTGNLMIHTTSKHYFVDEENVKDKIIGKPLLIDFGFSNKIPDDKMEKIRNHIKNGKYTLALKELCTVPRKDGLELFEYPIHYGWVCGYLDLSISRSEQEKYIQEIKKTIHDEILKKILDNYRKPFEKDSKRLEEYRKSKNLDDEKYQKMKEQMKEQMSECVHEGVNKRMDGRET